MAISDDAHYNHLTSECRYKNEKIIQAFNLFIKLATTIVAGVFFLDLQLDLSDPRRESFGQGADELFLLVAISMAFLILNNLHSWLGYRKEISKLVTSVSPPKGLSWFSSELIQCLVIGIACVGFIISNPLG